jgi:NAD-dependent SIR2 family protein deacetylase
MVTLKQSNPTKTPVGHDTDNCQVPGCERCALKKPFEMPPEILSACQSGNLVVFAGAGVSTESIGVFPSTFYQWVKDELSLPSEEKISFSKLMSLYCSEPRSRKDLLKAIQQRIDYVKTFSELYLSATEFHRELSTIPHLNDIFTTNWDDFFERECDATPIVTGEDFAVLQDVAGRKVYKLHGSIFNYGSIVATEEDYRKCYRNLSTGIVGAMLKTLLISKTLLFFGFSFDDQDFKRLYRLLNKDVAGLMPRSYVVTLDEKAKDKLDSLGIRATPIITSGAFFVKQLKKKLIEGKFMLPDEQYGGVKEILKQVLIEHAKLCTLSVIKHPDSLYSQWYQDGLQHSFERLLSTKKSGGNSCAHHMYDCIEEYERLIKDCLHQRNYPDVAYFTGYQAGMVYFLLDKKNRGGLPMYFLFGCDDIATFEQYLKLEKEAPKLHKTAHKLAEAIAQNVKSDLIVPHRKPFL